MAMRFEIFTGTLNSGGKSQGQLGAFSYGVAELRKLLKEHPDANVQWFQSSEVQHTILTAVVTWDEPKTEPS